MTRLTFGPDLVEEAVLLSERLGTIGDAGAFRRERNRIYEIDEGREREAGFRSLHLRYFTSLGLGRAVWRALRERPEVIARIDACRVVRAPSRRDEIADLADDPMGRAAGRLPTLIVSLRPETIVDPAAVGALLRHELMHVADMLDPAFGYQRQLPASQDGPSADNVLRERYRVLWDTTIDGRLVRSGLSEEAVRQARHWEFAATFAMLGDRRDGAFKPWFDEDHPTHAAILAFATAPGGREATEGSRCPVCRFPSASLDARVAAMSDEMVRAIRLRHPEWRREQGICAQCLDLYEARYEENCRAAR